jgi:hypothetical protein
MTTKIQPTNIDQTLDYSVDQLSANTVVVSGVDVLGYAQSAFLQANTVYNVANTLSPTDTFARTQANSAYIQANAAFIKANTGGASGLIYKASNTTPVTANVGDQWYSVTEDILYQYINDGTSNAWVDISSSAITTNAGGGGSTSPSVIYGLSTVFGNGL